MATTVTAAVPGAQPICTWVNPVASAAMSAVLITSGPAPPPTLTAVAAVAGCSNSVLLPYTLVAPPPKVMVSAVMEMAPRGTPAEPTVEEKLAVPPALTATVSGRPATSALNAREKLTAVAFSVVAPTSWAVLV